MTYCEWPKLQRARSRGFWESLNSASARKVLFAGIDGEIRRESSADGYHATRQLYRPSRCLVRLRWAALQTVEKFAGPLSRLPRKFYAYRALRGEHFAIERAALILFAAVDKVGNGSGLGYHEERQENCFRSLLNN
jgi:hypothetical protein